MFLPHLVRFLFGIYFLEKPLVDRETLGNLCAQFLVAGEMKNIHEIRTVIRTSFQIEEYLPENTPAWEDAYARFLNIISA